MYVKYLLLCDEATKSAQGKPILYGVFDSMTVMGDFKESEGVIHPKMVIAFEVNEMDLKKEHEVKVEMKHDDAKEPLFKQVFKTNKTDAGDRINGFIELVMFQLKKLGKHTIELSIDEVKVASTSLTVSKPEPVK